MYLIFRAKYELGKEIIWVKICKNERDQNETKSDKLLSREKISTQEQVTA